MRAKRIKAKLEEALSPTYLNIEDESDRHRNHGDWQGEGETHFKITIASPALADKSLIEQHRQINHLLAKEFEEGLHALSIRIEPENQ